MSKPPTCVGVDIGTSNMCLTSLVEGGVPVTIKSPQGLDLMPSAVYFPEDQVGEILFGDAALAKYPSKNLIIQPKRGFAINLALARKKKILNTFNAKVSVAPVYKETTDTTSTGKETKKKVKVPESQVGVKFVLKQDGVDKEITCEEVMEQLVAKAVQLVHSEHGEEVAFVWTRPQYWDSKRTEKFQEIIKKAIGPKGILVALITEPNAAQFAYQANNDDTNADERRRLFVLDLGGGTFDLSYLAETSPGVYQGVCTGGHDFLGGANIESEFLKTLKSEMKRIPSFKLKTFEKRESEFLAVCKELKHSLSCTGEVKTIIYGCTDEPFEFTINKDKKQVILQGFYKEISDTIDKCFEVKVRNTTKTAEEFKESVQRIFLVGGAMRDPVLSEELFSAKFPNAQIFGKPGKKGSINPEQAVAQGAAMWCAAKKKVASKISLPPDPVHRDIMNKSIGIEGVDTSDSEAKKMCVIVPANTELRACEGKQGFPTCVDNQSSVLIKVFSGEGEFTTSENVEYVGEFTVPLKTPNKVGEIFVDVEIEISKEHKMTVRAGKQGEKLTEMEFDYHN